MSEESTPLEGFSPYVQEHIGWYVYLLRDPRDQEVFYVGKGTGDRVFAHARAAIAIDDDVKAGLKLGRIREIHRAGRQVTTEILRHRISTQDRAYAIESAVIDALRATGHELTNEVLGHHHELYGWASTSTVATIYDASPMPKIATPMVLVKIPKLWTPSMSAKDLYDAARGWWTVGPRVVGAAHVLAVNKGVTRAAYRVEYWRERVPGDRDYSVGDRGRRLGFQGVPDEGHAELVGRSVGHTSAKVPVRPSSI